MHKELAWLVIWWLSLCLISCKEDRGLIECKCTYNDYSGVGYVRNFSPDGGSIIIDVYSDVANEKNVVIRCLSLDKTSISEAILKVNNTEYSFIISEFDKWNNVCFPIKLESGINSLKIYKKAGGKGYFRIDYIEL